MSKLSKQNRLQIPQEIMELTKTDFSTEVRLYVTDEYFFLDNPSDNNIKNFCVCRISLDEKNRIYLSKRVQKVLQIKPGDRFSCMLYYNKVTFKKQL